MKDGGRSLVDAVGLAKRVILVNQRFEGTALHKRADLGHFRGGENGGHSAVHVAALFPLFPILEERLFHGLNLAELRGGASVARGYPRVRVHGKGEIPVNEVDLAGADVIVHEPAMGSGEESLASRALKITEHFHRHGSVLRAE